jgi:hypothetical protein
VRVRATVRVRVRMMVREEDRNVLTGKVINIS